MRFPRLHLLWSRTLPLVLTLSALASSASAQECWVAAGGSATVDEAEFANATQSGVALAISNIGVVRARASVTGIFEPYPGDQKKLHLALQFLDNGPGARVRAYLSDVTLGTGILRDILVFDSDSYPPSAAYQTQQVSSTTCRSDNVLYVETSLTYVRLELTKSTADGAAAVRIMRVCQGYGCTAPGF